VPVHIWTDDVEQEAMKQLANVARMPFVHRHVAAMPDVHAGIGATVGSVIPIRGAIIPAAVGVDIGCGMIASQLSLGANELPDSLAKVRSAIEAGVPVGFDMHDENRIRRAAVMPLHERFEALLDRTPALIKMMRKPDTWQRQMGTLGGGNHFVELCLDRRIGCG